MYSLDCCSFLYIYFVVRKVDGGSKLSCVPFPFRAHTNFFTSKMAQKELLVQGLSQSKQTKVSDACEKSPPPFFFFISFPILFCRLLNRF